MFSISQKMPQFILNHQLCNNFMETNHSFTSVVLKHFPEDGEGKVLLERINTIILERKEGTKKKNSKRVGTCLCFLTDSFKGHQGSSKILQRLNLNFQ